METVGDGDSTMSAQFAECAGAIIEQASLRWGIPISEPTLVIPFLFERVSTPEALLTLATDDLVLVWATMQRLPRASDVLYDYIVPGIRSGLSTFDFSVDDKSDLQQSVLTDLLVGRSPKLLEYGGRAKLPRWVQVIAGRRAIDHLRKTKSQPLLDEELLESVIDDQMPASARLMKNVWKPTLQAAVKEAVAELSPKMRLILKLSVIDGLSTEQIARLHGTHKSTISRNLATTRYELLQHVVARFKQAGLQSVDEAGALADFLDSGIDLSLSRLLRAEL